MTVRSSRKDWWGKPRPGDVRLDREGNVVKVLGRKYNPDQPRVPAGESTGGQWTSGGSSPREFGKAVTAKNWGRDNYKDWRRSLSDDEKRAIYVYSASAWYGVNKVLRGQARHDDFYGYDTLGTQRILDRTISRTSVPEDIVVHRGMCSSASCVERMRQLKPGDEFTDKGFVSTSLVSWEAFKERVNVRITIPKGSRAAYLEDLTENKGEFEMLLARGSTFRVESSEARDDRLFLNVVLVGQE